MVPDFPCGFHGKAGCLSQSNGFCRDLQNIDTILVIYVLLPQSGNHTDNNNDNGNNNNNNDDDNPFLQETMSHKNGITVKHCILIMEVLL